MAGFAAVFNGTGCEEEVTAEKLVLREFQNNPDAWLKVMHILQNTKNLDDKLSALQVLEDATKSWWSALPIAQQDGMKNYVSKAIVQISGDQVSCHLERLHVNKLNVILVQILKHEGPMKWRTVIPDLVAVSERRERVCENFMAILKLLCEEVLDLSRGEMTEEEIEDLKLSLCSEFRLVHELFLRILSVSRPSKLICATLSTLHGFLCWLPFGYIFKSPLIETLLRLLPVTKYRSLTLQCLTEIAALNFGGSHDVHYVKMHNRFMVQLQAILTPTSDMFEYFADRITRQEAFIRNLALFLTTFYKFHIRVLESTEENIAALLVGLEVLYNISLLREREVVKVCLDYWNYLLERVAVQCFLDSPAIEKAQMMCLRVLKDVTMFRWDSLPVELRDGMKNYISEVIVQLLSNEASFRMERLFVERLNVILVQILKREGPVRWQSLIPNLVAAAKKSERVCENLMAILKLLSEEALDMSRGKMTQDDSYYGLFQLWSEEALDMSRGKMTQEEIKDLEESLNSGFQLVHESKKQLLAVSSELEGLEQQLLERSGSEEESAVELQKVLREPYPAQHSAQEAVRKQIAADSVASATASASASATATAMNEIQQLKVQLEEVSQLEAAKIRDLELANAELRSLRGILAEKLSLAENMKNQLQECKESEAQSRAQARESLLQPEIAKNAVEASPASYSSGSGLDNQETGGSLQMAAEPRYLGSVVMRLSPACGFALFKCLKEQTRRGAELEAELRRMKADVEELKANPLV